MQPTHRHQCLLYEGNLSKQLPALAAAMETKLKWNYRCLYYGAPAVISDLRRYLAATGTDVAAEVSEGRLIFSSERQLVNGRFDAQAMMSSVADALEKSLQDGYAGLWATGDVGWEIGSTDEAFRIPEYERQIEQLFHQYPQFSGVCQYHVDTLPPTAVGEALLVHPTIFINENLTRVNRHYVPHADHPPSTVSRTMLDRMIHGLIYPPGAEMAVFYRFKTPVGEFQICILKGNYFPALDGERIGTNAYIHPQFVVDDLITGVIDMRPEISLAASALPEDVHQWIRLDVN
jgi:hypothetical protein